MSESKQQWTPGPWELAPWGDLIGSNGDKVVFAGDGFSIGSRSNSTWKANGDVAKVAPELAEALQEAMRAASDTLFVLREMLENNYGHTHPRLENLADALDKATDVGYAALAKAGA
ncbi:hypothetical protein [Burkholderia gladioli]|uniref:hypothetical protein n=1 Tax=Burkholderia gladioli TaxID=28095 RepID=UPI001641CE93|nr:hypothetical protein [Burkholderia gladioli]